MTEYPYDGATIEEIITSHDTHDNYNSLRVWYRGEELNLKELKIVVYQEEETEMEAKEMTEQDELNLFIINASGDFLTEEFPSNFAQLDEEELYKFIREHIWQPFNDYYDWPEQVYEFIENSAYSTMRFVRTLTKGEA